LWLFFLSLNKPERVQKMMYVFKEGEIATAYKKLMTWLKETAFPEIRRHWIPLAIGGAILFVVVFVILTIPWVEQGQEEPQWTPWGEAIARIIAPFAAFIITLLGIWRVFMQFQIQIDQVKNQAENSRKQISAEQFKNAIDHLGDKKQAAVLGGVHALHNLAVNFPKEYSQQVFEVLCSFIREETTKPEYQERVLGEFEPSDETQPAVSNPAEPVTSLIVIQTIVDKLFREKIEVRDEKTGNNLELYRDHIANLSGAFLWGINFFKANLQEANLRNAKMQGSNLVLATMQGAKLELAHLQGAQLTGAYLQKANLRRAYLQRASLAGVKLQGADLLGTQLQMTLLYGANLLKANLFDANLLGANLLKTHLGGGGQLGRADFRGVMSSSIGAFEIVENAVENGIELMTDLCHISLYDDEGNELDLVDDEEKKEWFRERGANVDNLTTEDVRELFNDGEKVWFPKQGKSEDYEDDLSAEDMYEILKGASPGSTA